MRYAIKIGEVFAVSDKPIGDEERRAFVEHAYALMLEQGFVAEMLIDGVIEIRVAADAAR